MIPAAQPTPHSEFEADEEIHAASDNPPSWFARTYGDASAREMADQYRSTRPMPAYDQPLVAENAVAYEAYRKRLEERFTAAQHRADPAFMPQDNFEPAAGFPKRPTYAHGMPGHAQAAVSKKHRLGVKPSTIAVMALIACSLGSVGGYLGANPDQASRLMTSSLAFAGSLWPRPAQPASETVITKKTVHTAKLAVNDAEGAVNSPIPLDISAYPADVETPVALRISGLPPSAYLTKGVEISEGEWMLKASEIAQAELVVPHSDVQTLALQVYALEEKTGAPAAPSQDLRVKLDTKAVPVPGVPQPKTNVAVVMPAAAMPDQGFNKVELPTAVPVPVPLESMNPEAQGFIAKGERLLREGDVLAARQFFLRAFDLKVTNAAYGVGQTYDPAVYAKHNIKGLTPNPQQAAEWYGKAAAGGNEEASAALAELPMQP